ncbi:glycoside hydrolase [Mycena floridula]|nr:glycoside hydrolase [Mycena floridula]
MMLFPLLLTLSIAISQTFGQADPYGQCGGSNWSGPVTCTTEWTCIFSNPFYSQCLPAGSGTSTTTSAPTTSKTTSTTATTTSATLTGLPASAPTDPPSKLVGRTPALGWNSWNAYRCNINEAKILAAANFFSTNGLKAAGYQYINIDDCWSMTARNSSSKAIVPDPVKFPNGIASVATQVHALGLKFGIYSDAGTATCAGFPGSLGNEMLDASTFASWGVDYLKYDNCNVPGNWSDAGVPPNNDWYNSNSAIRYRQMGAALAKQSRPFQYNLCDWGNYNTWDWGARVGHSWRMSGDSSASWSYITSIITTNVAHLSAIDFFAHNDMDMLEIGNGALTIQEQRTHFAAWIFLKSPILLGTDLSLLNSTQLAIISNPELIAFHQDTTIGKPAVPFTATASAPKTSPPEYYAGQSSKGTHVFIINIGAATATKTFTFSNVPGLGTTGSFKVHDMWTGTDLSGTFTAASSFSVSVASHDTAAFFISPV